MGKEIKWSIASFSRISARFTIGLVAIILMTGVISAYSYFSINRYNNQQSIFLRYFNSYVLLVINSGGRLTEEIHNVYGELLDEHNHLYRGMTAGLELPEPSYTDEKSREAYSSELRAYAKTLRDNLSRIIEQRYLHITIMLSISIFASLVMLVMSVINRYVLNHYNKGIESGISYMRNLLNFQVEPQLVKKESKIAEVKQLYDSVHRLSTDIMYNRKLVDSGFHGNLDMLLVELFSSFRSRMSCDRIGLAFIDTTGNCIAETAITSFNITMLKPGFKEPIENTSLKDLIKERKPRIINDLQAYAAQKEGGLSESGALILAEGIKSSITIPMFFEDKCLGFFFISSLKAGSYNEDIQGYAVRIINLLKQKFYTEYLLQQVISETSNSFVGLMEEKDNETSAHIKRMSRYSYIIAGAYHENIRPLLPRFMREILWYAPLHDIGKVGIPDAILLKEAGLSTDERSKMKEHVLIGVRVMEKMNEQLVNIVTTPMMRTAVEIISGHHEKFDGTGYPAGLKGKDIPLAGRIVAVADVFDALTSKRPYKEAFSFEKAIDIIEKEMNSSFDPEVLSAFRSSLSEIRGVYDKLKEV